MHVESGLKSNSSAGEAGSAGVPARHPPVTENEAPKETAASGRQQPLKAQTVGGKVTSTS